MPGNARETPPQLECRARVAPFGSEGVAGSVRACPTAASEVQRNDREAEPPAGTAGPGASPNNYTSRPRAISGSSISRDGDSNNAASHELPPAAAVEPETTREDGGKRSSQPNKVLQGAPGQDTVAAGLLWSDFGGGREAGEDAEETASREFAEESFGMFHGVRLESDSVARSQVRSRKRWLNSLVMRSPSMTADRWRVKQALVDGVTLCSRRFVL